MAGTEGVRGIRGQEVRELKEGVCKDLSSFKK